MEIAIISDIHDNTKMLSIALEQIKSRGIKNAIFCGDFCSAFIIKQLAESAIEFHAVFGNNDGDRYHILKATENFSHIKLYGEYIGDTNCSLEFEGVKFGVSHYPFYAKSMVKTGWYDVVCFGHSHIAHRQKFGAALLINPGEIAGNFGPSTYAIYDTQTRGSEIVTINE